MFRVLSRGFQESGGETTVQKLGVLFCDEDGYDAVGRVYNVCITIVIEQSTNLGSFDPFDLTAWNHFLLANDLSGDDDVLIYVPIFVAAKQQDCERSQCGDSVQTNARNKAGHMATGIATVGGCHQENDNEKQQNGNQNGIKHKIHMFLFHGPTLLTSKLMLKAWGSAF
jgi:hypothetical protein